MPQLLIRVLGKISVCIFCLLLAFQPSADAATMLDHGALTLELAGAAPSHIADATLPYHWDRLHGAVNGRAHFVFLFTSNQPDLPQAIYMPRIGNTFEVRLNGVVIGRRGTAGSKNEDFAKQPHFFKVPSGVLRNDNTLEIAINVQGGRNGGLSTIMLGAEEEVRAAYTATYRWRISASLVVVIASMVLGSMALLLWFRQREKLYLLYAASEWLWALYISDTLIVQAPLPWAWWGTIVFSAEGLAAVLIIKFSLMVVDRHTGLLKRATDWNLLLIVPAVTIGIAGGLPWIEPLLKVTTDTVSLCAIIVIVRCGIRSAELEKKVLATGILIMACVAMRDEWVLVLLPYTGLVPAYANYYTEIAWSRNVWVVFGIVLAWIIAERMRKSAQEIANMNQTLSARLAQRESELSAAFAAQSSAERQQAMLEERQRLTRDMHDGLGSQLLGVLHLAQDPAMSRDALARQIRETLDHLKLTVDAMQDTEGDIASLLGALRYRLGPRLEAAGVRLAWSVEALPAVAGWTLQQSRDLQMILFEAFGNMLAHAGATEAKLNAAFCVESGRISISFSDNGRGFSAGADIGQGNGIRNMRARAARLCAEFHIRSSPQGTETALVLPSAIDD